MVSRRVSRSVRRLAGGLVVLAFLAAVAAPAQAAPGASATPEALELQVLDWIQDVLARFGLFTPEPPPTPEEEGMKRIFGKDCAEVDPSGGTCSENEALFGPPVQPGTPEA